MKFTYSIPTKILFGPGSFNDLATTPLPGKKALIVITAGKSMRANGYLDRLIAMPVSYTHLTLPTNSLV